MPLGRFVVWDTIGDHFSIDKANCCRQHVLLSHVSNDLMRCLLMIQPMVKASAWSPDTGLIFFIRRFGECVWGAGDEYCPQTHKVTE